MKHYGAEPPWRKETRYGWWRWVSPDPNSWFGEPGHWELQPPRTTLQKVNAVLSELYAPRISDFINSPVMFTALLGGTD